MVTDRLQIEPTATIHRRSVFWFTALLAASIPAFWPSYFFPPKAEGSLRVHAHGIAMFLWIALLIAQAGLIRANRRDLHRRLGTVSWFLLPFIVVSTLLVAHLRLNQGLNADLLYFFYLQLCLVSLLFVAWAMAMRHRRTPALHARYMVCTALAILDPIFARIFFFYLGIDYPLGQVMTFAMIDGILLLLAVRDWKARNGIRVFPAMLAAFIVTQVPTFFISTTPGWRAFAQWYAALPLP